MSNERRVILSAKRVKAARAKEKKASIDAQGQLSARLEDAVNTIMVRRLERSPFHSITSSSILGGYDCLALDQGNRGEYISAKDMKHMLGLAVAAGRAQEFLRLHTLLGLDLKLSESDLAEFERQSLALDPLCDLPAASWVRYLAERSDTRWRLCADVLPPVSIPVEGTSGDAPPVRVYKYMAREADGTGGGWRSPYERGERKPDPTKWRYLTTRKNG